MNGINKNQDKKIWLELELRADIDDYITLVYALENKLNVTEVSIHNPSIKELDLLYVTLERFNQLHTIPIIIAGGIRDYGETRDIHKSLLPLIKDMNKEKRLTKKVDYLLPYLQEKSDFSNKVVFCGGSMFTLAKIVQSTNQTIEACIQGGYASEEIVGKENVLDKFKGRDKVPTWNLNLDIESSDILMKAPNLKAHFISKNVCHNTWLHKDEINTSKTVLNETLINYFKDNKHNSKCMHDWVAFMTIFNNDIVTFKEVELKHTDKKRPEWYSVLKAGSNKKISTSINLDVYHDIVKNYRIVKNLKKKSQKNPNEKKSYTNNSL